MNRTLLVALAILGVIAATVIVLGGGGDPRAGARDAASDVVVGEGPRPPGDPSRADITVAEVTRQGNGDVVLEVMMAADIPETSSKEALSFRWDLIENGESTWMVSANLNDGPIAAISSSTTNYGASTVDGTLPGSIAVTGDTLTVTVQVGEIEDFPSSFSWKLITTLDADRDDPASAVATDSAPDAGPGEVE